MRYVTAAESCGRAVRGRIPLAPHCGHPFVGPGCWLRTQRRNAPQPVLRASDTHADGTPVHHPIDEPPFTFRAPPMSCRTARAVAKPLSVWLRPPLRPSPALVSQKAHIRLEIGVSSRCDTHNVSRCGCCLRVEPHSVGSGCVCQRPPRETAGPVRDPREENGNRRRRASVRCGRMIVTRRQARGLCSGVSSLSDTHAPSVNRRSPSQALPAHGQHDRLE